MVVTFEHCINEFLPENNSILSKYIILKNFEGQIDFSLSLSFADTFCSLTGRIKHGSNDKRNSILTILEIFLLPPFRIIFFFFFLEFKQFN